MRFSTAVIGFVCDCIRALQINRTSHISSENNMAPMKTISTFAILLIVIGLSSVSSIHPGRSTSMNLYDFNHYWNICVGSGSSTGNLYLYSDAGPYGVTWVAVVQIGLNGGDNTQYASFSFNMFDDGQGDIWKGYFGAATSNWIQQGISFSGSMTAPFVRGINLVLNVNNPDGVSQCFNVRVTLWDY